MSTLSKGVVGNASHGFDAVGKASRESDDDPAVAIAASPGVRPHGDHRPFDDPEER